MHDDRRIRIGRLAVYIEPRDAWIGVYVAPTAVYVLLVPFLVLRWTRRPNVGEHFRRLAPETRVRLARENTEEANDAQG